jgi:hypothetical protein
MLKRLLRSAPLVAAVAAAIATPPLMSAPAASAAMQRHSIVAAQDAVAPELGAPEAAMYPIERTVPLSIQGNCTSIRNGWSRLGSESARTAECVQPVTGMSGIRMSATAAASSLCAVNKVRRTRHASCGIAEFVATIVRVPTGKVLGTGVIALGYQESLSASSRSWTLPAQIELVSATGVVRTGTTARTIMDCTGGCGSSGPWQTPLAVGRVYGHDYHVTSPGTGTAATRQTPVVTIANPASTDEPTAHALNLGPARCDSIAYGKTSGCVFSDMAAAYYAYLKGHNEDAVALNIENGEKNKPLHFGWYGHGQVLRRATNSGVQAANRKAACGKARFKKPLTCDEYPFAATFEGAAYYPHDYVIAGVPSSQNSAEGAYRVNMYRTERLINDDPYWVFVV